MITESLDHDILSKESFQPQSSYEAATSLIEFELKKILIDKMDKSESYLAALEHRSGSSKGAQSQSKSSRKSVQLEEQEFEFADSNMPQDQEENPGNDDEEPKGESVEVMRKHGYGFLREIEVRRADNDLYTFKEEKFNTIVGNHVKENLLKLNLPDHRSILMDSKVTLTKHGQITKPYSSPRFIANCFISGIYKDGRGGAEPLKSKKPKMKSDLAISSEETPSKKMPTKTKKDVPSKMKPTSKPKPTKKKAPVKADRGKGLNVLSEVALSEAAHLKESTKQSKKDFHISQASGLGDSGEEEDDDDDEDDTEDNESNDDGDDSNDNDDIDNNGDDDDDNKEDDDKNDDEEETDREEEEKIDDEENMDEEEDDKVTKELYKDVNVNLGNEDAEMTNVDQGGADQQNISQESVYAHVEEDTYVTLTTVHDIQKIDETMQIPEITYVFTTTTHPPPHFFNPLSQQATPTPTPTASETTTSLPALPDFAYVFKFNERITNLKKDLSEMKQVDQYAQALSTIHAIVDCYIDNKLGDAIQKAIQAHNLDYREEAQTEKILDFATPVIEKNVTKSLEAAVLARSSSQPKSTYKAAASRSQDDIDKDQDPSARSDRGTKRRKSSKEVELSRDSRSKEKKSSSTSKDASHSQHKTFGKYAHAEDPSHTVDDSGVQQNQEFDKDNNDEQPLTRRFPRLTGLKNSSDLQLLILIGIRDNMLTFDLLGPGLVKLLVLKNLLLYLMRS
uniref:Uncharacterized protein n=1 Tax=Tanacetum cinerariifolium TaxID=118510 RepID=A0A699H2L0_TANCI|nr:hypothetical protein [Tanacetum cinerariifolium]